MKQVKSFDEYNSTFKNFRKNNKIKYSNNLLMKKDIEDLTSQGNLYVDKSEDSLTYFVKEKHHYQLYFSSASDQLRLPKLEKNVKFDYVTREKEPQRLPLIQNLIEDDWTLIANNIEMFIKSDIIVEKELFNYKLEKAKQSEIDAIQTLWLDALNEASNEIPSLKDLSENHQSILLLKKDNNIVGGAYIKQLGNRYFLEHVAIDKIHRGKGLGQILLLNILAYLHGKNIFLWVDKNNTSAVNLYKKNGFKETNKKSLQLLKEKKQ